VASSLEIALFAVPEQGSLNGSAEGVVGTTGGAVIPSMFDASTALAKKV